MKMDFVVVIMYLTKQSINILIDLIEIKLSAILVQDREDARELVRLQNCKKELMSMFKQHQMVPPKENHQNMRKHVTIF